MLNDLPTPTVRFLSFPSIMVQCKCAACQDKFLTFEFEDDFLVVLHREEAAAASSDILKEHAIPSVRSSDLSEPYVEAKNEVQKTSEDFGESPVTNFEMGIDCLLWAWPYWERSFRWSCRPEKCVHLPVDTGCGISTILLPLCGPTRTVAAKLSHVVCLE